jgi:hypothetical protein
MTSRERQQSDGPDDTSRIFLDKKSG